VGQVGDVGMPLGGEIRQRAVRGQAGGVGVEGDELDQPGAGGGGSGTGSLDAANITYFGAEQAGLQVLRQPGAAGQCGQRAP
jgi:hypothetical protein